MIIARRLLTKINFTLTYFISLSGLKIPACFPKIEGPEEDRERLTSVFPSGDVYMVVTNINMTV